jgi:hypothetical protein
VLAPGPQDSKLDCTESTPPPHEPLATCTGKSTTGGITRKCTSSKDNLRRNPKPTPSSPSASALYNRLQVLQRGEGTGDTLHREGARKAERSQKGGKSGPVQSSLSLSPGPGCPSTRTDRIRTRAKSRPCPQTQETAPCYLNLYNVERREDRSSRFRKAQLRSRPLHQGVRQGHYRVSPPSRALHHRIARLERNRDQAF